MNIERVSDEIVSQAVFTAFSAILTAQPPEFEPLTGKVTMTNAERQESIDEGVEEMFDGAAKIWSGAFGERLIPKGSRQKSAKPRTTKINGKKPKRLSPNSIIRFPIIQLD